jgi:hypothetical protein
VRAQVEQRVRRGELPRAALLEAMEAERQAIAQQQRAAQQRAQAAAKPEKPRASKAPRKPATPADPRLAAMARELRDRWLEELARDPTLILPRAKYDLARALPAPVSPVTIVPAEIRALPQAA